MNQQHSRSASASATEVSYPTQRISTPIPAPAKKQETPRSSRYTADQHSKPYSHAEDPVDVTAYFNSFRHHTPATETENQRRDKPGSAEPDSTDSTEPASAEASNTGSTEKSEIQIIVAKPTIRDRIGTFMLRGALATFVAAIIIMVSAIFIANSSDSASANKELSVAQAEEIRKAQLDALLDETNPDNAVFDERAEELLAASAGVRSSAQAGMIKKFLSDSMRYEQARQLSGDLTGYQVGTLVADILGVSASNMKVVAPMKPGSYELTAGYHDYGMWGGAPHSGQDFGAPTGTPVYATTDGVIASCIGDFWPGTHIVLAHPDGSFSLYAHLNSKSVQPGDIVKAGQEIGQVGNTGRSFGAHLHYDHFPVGVVPGSISNTDDPHLWFANRGVNI